MVPIPTLPPNVANPDDRNVVVVAFVVTSLLIQAVSETERYVEEALVRVAVVAVKLGAVTSPDGAMEKTEEVDE